MKSKRVSPDERRLRVVPHPKHIRKNNFLFYPVWCDRRRPIKSTCRMLHKALMKRLAWPTCFPFSCLNWQCAPWCFGAMVVSIRDPWNLSLAPSAGSEIHTLWLVGVRCIDWWTWTTNIVITRSVSGGLKTLGHQDAKKHEQSQFRPTSSYNFDPSYLPLLFPVQWEIIINVSGALTPLKTSCPV